MTKKDIVLKITDTTGIKQIDVKKIVQLTCGKEKIVPPIQIVSSSG